MQKQLNKQINTMQCALNLTANARKGIEKHFKSAQSFINAEQSFSLFIEKNPENRQGNESFSFFFDNEHNKNLCKLLDGRVAVMECVIQNERFLATGFHLRGSRERVKTNRRRESVITFTMDQTIAGQIPIELYTALRELPIATERSEYVEKRIGSWEGYLQIQELHADVEDIKTHFTHPVIQEDFSKIQILCQQLNRKQLQTINGFSASITGLSGEIGNVTQVKHNEKMVEIELNAKYRNEARKQNLKLNESHEVTFNNFAELSQIRRLRKGFKDLQDGLAANPNLEKMLFEERPVVRITNNKKDLQFHSRLNEYQREAVIGAMSAHDLYVIQGPPGTGKTTVIAEICYQNSKAGLKTLVASQANLAVDNALGRLLNDPDIRILRYGRTESIEEEGKKFIEENVAHFWKEQTIEQVKGQLNNIQQRKKNCTNLIKENKRKEQSIAESIVVLKEKLQNQKNVQEKHKALSEKCATKREEKNLLSEKKHSFEKEEKDLTTDIQKVDEEIEQLQKSIKELGIHKEDIRLLDNQKAEIEDLKRQLKSVEAFTSYKNNENLLVDFQDNKRTMEKKLQNLELFLEDTIFTSKLMDFKQRMEDSTHTYSENIMIKIFSLESKIAQIRQQFSNESMTDWIKLEERIDRAMPIIFNIIQAHGGISANKQSAYYKRVLKLEEANQFLNRLGLFLKDPETKRLFQTRNFSLERYDRLNRLKDSYQLLMNQKQYIQENITLTAKKQQMLNDSKVAFQEIKRLVVEEANREVESIKSDLTRLDERIAHIHSEQEEFKKLQSNHVGEKSIEELKQTLFEVEKEYQHLSFTYQSYEEMNAKLIKLTKEKKQITFLIKEKIGTIHLLSAKEKKLDESIKSIEEELLPLEKVIQEDIEGDIQLKKKQEADIQSEIQSLQLEIDQLPIKEGLQKQWLTMLETATEYDLEEIKRLYIEHANVIGTTCVASARRDFVEEYPEFDVVIIDEVSKATPPELLLPMLKGKKIILVGDHHQLPPLIGQGTMEELLEERSTAEEKEELAFLLKESLFERLFRTLPKQNKAMLQIQYRMHEKIMETIAPFYNEDSYQLQCGLENSDAERNHLLETNDLNENNHLLWFDIPNEQAFFEKQVKGGTSRYNEAELTQIKKLLIDLNNATEKAIQSGKLPADEKKQVGVISFYAEQVKRIDRLVQHELSLPHLHIRTGSVDKFQGMEMDVIMLSFVRNHHQPNGDIGFAKDYRRLNVALSRARELLMIIGSSEMFTQRPKSKATRAMFTRLLEDVKKQNGLREIVKEVV